MIPTRAFDVSFVIPVFNEEENIPDLYRELTAAGDKLGRSYEMIFVDDGSTDGSFPALQPHPGRRSPGQGHPPAQEFRPDSGPLGRVRPRPRRDHRHPGRRPAERPADTALLLAKMDEGYDIVSGWRHQAEGQARLQAAPLQDRQLDHLPGHRGQAPRLRLHAQGLPPRGRQAHPALRRDAPLHPGHRQHHGRRPSPRSRSTTGRASTASRSTTCPSRSGSSSTS